VRYTSEKNFNHTGYKRHRIISKVSNIHEEKSRWNRRRRFITGASGGIGYELAKLFAKDHYDLVLVARSGDKLNQVAGELRQQFG